MPALGLFDLHDDGGMRPAQQLRKNHAGLRVTVIVGLQAREDQVKLLIFDGGRERARRVECIKPDERVVFEMDGAVRSLGESLAQIPGWIAPGPR